MRSLILLAAVLTAGPRVGAEEMPLGSLPAYRPDAIVSGTIRSWGNDGMAELMRQWEDGFRKHHPGVRFDDKLPSSAVAIPGLAAEVADVAVMGRELWPVEALAYKRARGVAPFAVEVGTGLDVSTWAMVIFVHKDNPISNLTLAQLDGIFGSERTGGWDAEKAQWLPEKGRGPERNIRTWGQLGLTGDWNDKPIQVYGYDLNRSGFSLGFASKVFGGGDTWNERLKEFVSLRRADGSVVEASRLATEALGKDRYGITYSSRPDATPLVKAVAVAAKDGGPYVEATTQTIRERTYPLFRSLYLLAHRPRGTPLAAKVKEFLRFALSREGQLVVARDGTYLPLPVNVVREQLKKLE